MSIKNILDSMDNKDELTQELIDSVKDIDHPINNHKWRIIHVASYRSHKKSIKLLIDNDVDLNVQNDQGQTPLYTVISDGTHPDIVELLLDNGADPHIAENNGRTPLQHAIFNSNLIVTELLVKYMDDFSNEPAKTKVVLSENIESSPNAAKWNKVLNMINGTMYGRGR